jgi:hypothetical protein
MFALTKAKANSRRAQAWALVSHPRIEGEKTSHPVHNRNERL